MLIGKCSLFVQLTAIVFLRDTISSGGVNVFCESGEETILLNKFNLMQDYSTLTNKDIVAKARAIILADLSIYDSVPALAKKAGTNPYTLKKVFKEMYGESVFSFSRGQRIELAKKLLLETNYTLQTIGEMVGYSEGNNFQVSFKVVVGMTPGEFRRGVRREA